MIVHETCSARLSAPSEVLRNLPPSQAGLGRHQRCVCAYQRGRKDALAARRVGPPGTDRCQHGTLVPLGLFADIHGNQGGIGRHKCVHCAYREGYRSIDLNE